MADTNRKYRVVQWGTGNVGVHGLKHILTHPMMELVGLRVYGDAKAGLDAGALCGMADTGVIATTNGASILDLDADCVAYMGADSLISDPREPGSRADTLLGDICALLSAGKNVVATSIVGLSFPPYFGESVVGRLNEACARGETTFHCTGIDPGFIGDVLLTSITSLSQRITSVRYYELLTARTYNDPAFVFGIGFGKPVAEFERQGMLFSLSNCWGPTLHGIADALGIAIDGVRERVKAYAAERDVRIAAGLIPKGTVGAIHFELAAVRGGREVITVEHVSRVDDDVAPHLTKIAGSGGYRVVVEGTPSMRVELAFGEGGHADPTYEACMATAARAVNSVPQVCAAAPGILMYRDMKPVAGRWLLA
ncbi:MAG: dihydrodipicolinate reductase [Gammaproteobacteria bacterium]